MNVKKIILGSFIGTLFGLLISSTYFFVFFKRVNKKLREDFTRYDDLK